jgi:uncharacterized protein (DUF3820 family)
MFADEFQQRIDKMLESKTIPFGKYINSSLRAIFDHDKSYLLWLLEQNWFEVKFASLNDTIVLMFQKYKAELEGKDCLSDAERAGLGNLNRAISGVSA